EKPYHAKRPHRKSRLGCRNCKTRKVKCDEKKPSCRNCALRRETCVYPSQSQHSAAAARSTGASAASASASASFSSAPAPASASTPTSASFPTSPGSASALPPGHGDVDLIIVDEPLIKLAGPDEFDMKLLWFYTAETYTSFSVEAGKLPHVDAILRSQIVQFAFQSPFLMDCILGLSAQHMQFLHQPVPMSKALLYKQRAFAGYRQAIERAEPKDFPALLSCSLLLCALSSELFRQRDMRPLYIIDWMVVWRGIGLIFEMLPREVLFDSGLEKLFSRPVFDLNQGALHSPPNLLFMVTSIKEGDRDYPFTETYYNALKYLGGLYRELENGFSPVLSLRVITWFTFLPKDFIELAKRRTPRTLIIMAHYLPFLKLINNIWWLSGIADRGIQDIMNYLPVEWHHLLNVPRTALQISDKVELAKLIQGNHAWEPTSARSEVVP
ncbi:hypothetical protein M406DRAFT_25035, partial [Cryphonectria parasitica EP155]